MFLRYFFIGMILSFFFCHDAMACVAQEAPFLFKVQSLTINKARLESLCQKETCVVEPDKSEIRLTAASDPGIGVRVSTSLVFVLPYNIGKVWPKIWPGKADPKTYNWAKTVRAELLHLRDLGVLDMSDADISFVTEHAGSGKAVGKCFNEWFEGAAECFLGCRANGEGISIYDWSVKQLGMDWEDFVQKIEQFKWGREESSNQVFLNFEKIYSSRKDWEQVFGKNLSMLIEKKIAESMWMCPNCVTGEVNATENFPPEAL
ncbi:MAG: hypothetical protein HQL16_05750 [Candidatus Omnitrophica bacterium]|nr:hypothetical protein [Candidatus Omnitrophota bacterium]